MTDHLLQLWSVAPNQTAEPTRTAVGPLPFGRLSLAEELSRPGRLDCGVALDQLPAESHKHLFDPFTNPAEISLDRRGRDRTRRRVFTGLLTSPAIRQGRSVQIRASGLLAYLAYMMVDGNTGAYSFSGVDQHQIVKSLVDGWQALDYGHLGIDTSQVADAGKTRTVDYPLGAIHIVLDRAVELGERQGGFDIAVDHDTRELELWTPSRGTDRSDQVHFDARNISSADEDRSVAPGESATSVHAVSSGGDPDDTVLTSTVTDLEAMKKFGRRGHGISERNIVEQASLDDKAQQALDERTSMRFEPGPQMQLAVGADWDDFAVGDRVDVRFDAGLGETRTQPRVAKRRLQVAADGTEKLRLGFG